MVFLDNLGYNRGLEEVGEYPIISGGKDRGMGWTVTSRPGETTVDRILKGVNYLFGMTGVYH